MRRPEIYVHRRNLLHWRLASAIYFVTWRAPDLEEYLWVGVRD
jgi:hypothetical protein